MINAHAWNIDKFDVVFMFINPMNDLKIIHCNDEHTYNIHFVCASASIHHHNR